MNRWGNCWSLRTEQLAGGKAWTEGRRTWGQPHRGPDLQWLGDKHALHEGDSHGDEPLEGAGPPIVQAVEHGEEGCHPACDYHQEPAHQDTPPGQASRELACLQETAGEGGCDQCGPIWAQVQLLLHLHQLRDLVKLLDPLDPQFSPLSCSVSCLIYIHVCYWGHLYQCLLGASAHTDCFIQMASLEGWYYIIVFIMKIPHYTKISE